MSTAEIGAETERQFRRANRELDRTAARITREISKLLGRCASEWPEVGEDYVVANLLLELLRAPGGILPMLDGLSYIGTRIEGRTNGTLRISRKTEA